MIYEESLDELFSTNEIEFNSLRIVLAASDSKSHSLPRNISNYSDIISILLHKSPNLASPPRVKYSFTLIVYSSSLYELIENWSIVWSVECWCLIIAGISWLIIVILVCVMIYLICSC